jgi:O-6-methylguanine DNA methyltransferase
MRSEQLFGSVLSRPKIGRSFRVAPLQLRAYIGRISYGELAARLGDKDAMRAVGLANARNPTSVVLPFHRVVDSDGTLIGYGGGLPRKAWLLDHEGVLCR